MGRLFGFVLMKGFFALQALAISCSIAMAQGEWCLGRQPDASDLPAFVVSFATAFAACTVLTSNLLQTVFRGGCLEHAAGLVWGQM